MSKPEDMDRRIASAEQLLAARRGQRRGSPERSFLTISELDREQVGHLLAGGLDAKRNPQSLSRALEGKSVALLFQKTSTRTRCSFEIGVGEMGGQPMYIDWRTSNFTLADLQDEIRVLSRYVDLIMARVNDHEDLLVMKQYSEVPVINGLCNLYHPCQGLTDFMTMLEYFGDLKGLKLGYVGDGNNVCQSLINGAVRVGMEIVVAHPPGYGPREEIVDAARTLGSVTLSDRPEDAVREADVVYTDTWVSMGEEAEKEIRHREFARYQVNEELLALAPSHALVMHCLPAHRGYEISAGALDSPNSVVFEQAENRKHLQKYLMAWILETVPR